MKSTILTLVAFVSYFLLNAQERESFDCRILSGTVTSKEFIDHFHIKKSIDPLEIIDTNTYFRFCRLENLEGRIVKIDQEYPKNADVNKGSGKENRNKIVLYKLMRKGRYYYTSFWQPYGNANLVLRIKLKKNKKYRVKLISAGVF